MNPRTTSVLPMPRILPLSVSAPAHVPELAQIIFFPSVTAKLLSEGFCPGAPATILPETIAIDARICKRMKCPTCGTRGLGYCPMNNGKNYTVVATCQVCGFQEEM